MNTKRHPLKIAAMLTLTALPLALHAATSVLSIDFGASGGTAYTGTNTPAHAAGLLTGDVTFLQSGNARSTTDIDPSANTLLISVERGGIATSYTVGTNGQVGTSSTATITDGTGSGVFATNLTNDGVISVNTETNPRGPVGAMVNINNLANGDYALFVVAHIGANSPFATQNMRVSYEIQGVDLGTGNKTFTTAAPLSQMTTLSASTTASWVEGNNYARFNFTIDGNTPANRTLFIASNDITGADQTTLSAMQLVAIPEPSTLILMGMGVLAVVGTRSRRAHAGGAGGNGVNK